jgi:EAL domain-containing protein (putative c-di-GMP-specific phosphodiesterase class I)
VPVSVNLSARSVGMPGLAEWVIDQLAVRQLPSSALTVEVTETAAVDTVRAAHLLGPLRDRGVRISIDDFGTGYTSLAALPVLPVDELKVDMQFVRRLRESPADAAIVASVVQLAHALGLSAVAEGVEDAAVAAVLADLGYELLQGYHYSPPVDEHRFVALLDERWAAPPEPDVYAPAR